MRIVTAAALAVVGVAGVIATSVSGPALAASDGTRPTTVRAAQPLGVGLTHVACRTSANCVAVGSTAAPAPVSEMWNGKAWHSVRVGLPAGAPHGGLDGVACPGPSTAKCVAVGWDYPTVFHGAYNVGLGEAWNGKAWAPTQLALAANTTLDSVSCLSVKSCLAVGVQNSPEGGFGGPIAYTWNGGKWAPLAIPASAQRFSFNTAFTDVSCVAGRFCLVAGYIPTKSGGSTTLTYRWNGRSWAGATLAPLPRGVADRPVTTSVSCASATSCLAVVNGTDKGADVTVAELWNGKTWSVTRPMAWPKGATNPTASDVSCPTARYCVAVGNVDSTPNVFGYVTGRAAASVWNGKAWTASGSIAAPGQGNASQLAGVTCLRPTFCVAAGQVGPSDSASFLTRGVAMTEFWNGKTWREVSLR